MATEKKITMKDIAKEFDVSIVTVSKALAGKDGVGEQLRQEIVERAHELGYVFKKNPERSGSKNVAIVISERFIGENSFYQKVYQRILLELTRRNFVAILEAVRVEDEEKGELPKLLSLKSIDQIIVIGEISNAYLRAVVRTGIGCILFDFENEDFDMDAVISDNVNGGYLLTRHLIQSGCKSVGFVGNYFSTRSNLDRFIGYRKYLIANQLTFDENNVISDRDEHGRDIDLVLPAKLPDAFVCTCDHTAFRLIRKLLDEGFRIPEDIAVVGYDDYTDNRIDGVDLTTYHVNIEEMISQCMNILEQHCENSEYRYGTVISYGWLVERSTGKHRK
ncbi:MAG: LacI family DNA-binding transcriptional regulator [Eubacterium sp.]|nr:LacI family DNA-binding transcriptional regulator [Eubacterium sp.]